MTDRLPCPAWAAERLFERAGVEPHAPSDSYRGDLAALCDPESRLLCGHVDPTVDKVKDHRGTGDARDRSFKFCFGGNQLFQEV